MRLVGSRNTQPHRLGAGRQQQPVVTQAFAPRDNDFASLGIDTANRGLAAQIDAVFGIEIVGAQRQPIVRRAAGEVILRQIGPVNRRRIVIAQHHDAAAVLAPQQHFGGGKAGGATADDDNSLRRVRFGGFAARLRLLALLPHDNAPVARLDVPACDRA
jgi:hypothetical protein